MLGNSLTLCTTLRYSVWAGVKLHQRSVKWTFAQWPGGRRGGEQNGGLNFPTFHKDGWEQMWLWLLEKEPQLMYSHPEDLPSLFSRGHWNLGVMLRAKSKYLEPSPILQYWENILCLLTMGWPSTQEGQALLFPASFHVDVGVTCAPITAQAPQILLYSDI